MLLDASFHLMHKGVPRTCYSLLLELELKHLNASAMSSWRLFQLIECRQVLMLQLCLYSFCVWLSLCGALPIALEHWQVERDEVWTGSYPAASSWCCTAISWLPRHTTRSFPSPSPGGIIHIRELKSRITSTWTLSLLGEGIYSESTPSFSNSFITF